MPYAMTHKSRLTQNCFVNGACSREGGEVGGGGVPPDPPGRSAINYILSAKNTKPRYAPAPLTPSLPPFFKNRNRLGVSSGKYPAIRYTVKRKFFSLDTI